MVLPPPLTPSRDDPEEKLPTWSGTPLDPENLGAHLEPGVLFCQVGDPKDWRPSWSSIRPTGTSSRKARPSTSSWKAFPRSRSTATIKEIAESALKITPQAALDQVGRRTAHQDQPADRRRGADEHLLSGPRPIDDPAGQYRLGLRGQARIYTKWISLGARLWRLVTHTFNFKLS